MLPRLKGFAGPTFYLKACAVLALTFCLEWHVHATGQYVWYLTAPLGFLMALIGASFPFSGCPLPPRLYPLCFQA